KLVSGERGDDGLTGSGKMLGTPDYVAPEQTLDAARADVRSDIYSLGCTLYFLLTGGPPFQAGSLFEVLLAHQSAEPRPLNVARPAVPEQPRAGSAGSAKRRPRPVRTVSKQQRHMAAGVLAGLALVALIGLWAGGVFKVKTKDGTIVLENLPDDAEVLVDGDK